MGSHIVDGEFQSDKYPTCPRGKVPLSVRDHSAQDLLWEHAQRRRKVDAEFSADLETALTVAGYAPPCGNPRIDASHCESCAGLSVARSKRLAEMEAEIVRLRNVIGRNAALARSSVGAPALAAEKMRLACLDVLRDSPNMRAAVKAIEALKIEEVIRG